MNQPKLTINGDLYEDIFMQAIVLASLYANDNWHVLARTGSVFTAYKTDDFFEFKIDKRYTLTQPSALKRFKADYDPQPGKTDDPLWQPKPGKKTMKMGDWQKLNAV